MHGLDLCFWEGYPGAAGMKCARVRRDKRALRLPVLSTQGAVLVTDHLRFHNTREACSSAQLCAERSGEFSWGSDVLIPQILPLARRPLNLPFFPTWGGAPSL